MLNASPEIRQQIESFPGLHPKELRQTPVSGVVLTSGDLDHCLGLLSLRESQRLVVYATDTVRRSFVEGNGLYRTLERFQGQLKWERLVLGEQQRLIAADGSDSRLRLTAIAVPGKPPLHAMQAQPHPEDNVGLRIADPQTSGVLAYGSGVASLSNGVEALVAGTDLVFFDGTFWTRDELVRLGIGQRYAEDMAHWPIGEVGGSLEFLRSLSARERVFIHVNNTNPILRDDSRERQLIEAAGLKVAHDGMEFRL